MISSVPWSRQLCQTWRLWFIEVDAVPRFRFYLCRDALLHVTRNLCGGKIYFILGYLVVGLHHVRVMRTKAPFQCQNTLPSCPQNQRRPSGSATKYLLTRFAKCYKELSKNKPVTPSRHRTTSQSPHDKIDEKGKGGCGARKNSQNFGGASKAKD